jgi:hypothetical protein
MARWAHRGLSAWAQRHCSATDQRITRAIEETAPRATRNQRFVVRLVAGPVEVRHVPDPTHILRRDPDSAPPVDPDLLEGIAKWLSAHLQGQEVPVRD